MTPRPVGKLVVHHRSPGVAIGTLDAFFLMRCFGHVGPDDIEATLKCSDVLNAYRPQGSVSIVVVDPTSAFPSEETRRAALDATRRTRALTAGHVVIVAGDGFWASAIRGVLTTLAALAQTSFPRKVVRYEDEGIDAAIEMLGEPVIKYRAPLLAALSYLKGAGSQPPPSSKSNPSSQDAPPSTPRTSPKRQTR
ncbi:MAG: hypothetical protein ABW133_04285 [Polyangiaceae bacterium]